MVIRHRLEYRRINVFSELISFGYQSQIIGLLMHIIYPNSNQILRKGVRSYHSRAKHFLADKFKIHRARAGHTNGRPIL